MQKLRVGVEILERQLSERGIPDPQFREVLEQIQEHGLTPAPKLVGNKITWRKLRDAEAVLPGDMMAIDDPNLRGDCRYMRSIQEELFGKPYQPTVSLEGCVWRPVEVKEIWE